jgi:replication factor C subunit 1
MDIRNFFGKPAAPKPAASAPSAGVAPARSAPSAPAPRSPPARWPTGKLPESAQARTAAAAAATAAAVAAGASATVDLTGSSSDGGAEVARQPIKELKAELVARGVSTVGMTTRDELEAALSASAPRELSAPPLGGSASSAASPAAARPSAVAAAKRPKTDGAEGGGAPPAAAGAAGASAATSPPGTKRSRTTAPLEPLQTISAPEPRGARDCLEHEVVVFTGLLDTLTRDAAEALVVRFGGRCTGAVSGKTTMLVTGRVLEDGRPIESGSKFREVTDRNEKAGEPVVRVFNEASFINFLESTLPSAERAAQRVSGAAGVGVSGAGAGVGMGVGAGAIERAPREMSGLWTDKYAPIGFAELVGHQGQVTSLDNWIRDWEDMHVTGKKPIPAKAGGTCAGARAALLSGPPGIGKTTTAALLAKRHNYEVLEMNASDARAARHVKTIIGTATTSGSLHGGRRLIIMDEVDGMSSGDRGGNQELIKLIKDSRVPIIAICNDRQKPAVRTLANHCYDLKFARPLKSAIATRLAQICAKEGLSVTMPALEALAESCGSDLRAMLNTLQMWAKRSVDSAPRATIGTAELSARVGAVQKDFNLRLDAFSAVPRMFSETRAPLEARADFFFVDYDMAPLLIAQMYIDCVSRSSSGSSAHDDRQKLMRCARAAEAISEADVYSTVIRSQQEWGLLPHMAIALVRATTIAACQAPPAIMFPVWLGKNSKRNKHARLLAEFGLHMGANVSGGREAIRLDIIDPLRTRLCTPLTTAGNATDPLPLVQSTIALLDEYGLSNVRCDLYYSIAVE